MALTDDNMVMPVSPMYGNGGGGFGNFGGDGWWIILLFVLLGGWNNGFGGMGGANGSSLYPWMNQAEITTSGFQNSMLNDGITGIRDGISGISSQLCNGFAGTTAAITGAQNALAQQMYTNQISDLERSFAAQTASTAGMSAIQSQLAQCCCDNRLATNDLKYTIATENCADRAALSDGLRDLLTAQTASTQRILDQLCQDKIDAKNDEIAQLRQEILYARGQASQIAQNQQVIDGIYNRLDTCPVGTTPVFGRTPIFTCGGQQTCGCGCNSTAF